MRTTEFFVHQKMLRKLSRFAKSIKDDRTKETLTIRIFIYLLFIYFSVNFSVLRLVTQNTQQENSPPPRISLCHLILRISILGPRMLAKKTVAWPWG